MDALGATASIVALIQLATEIVSYVSAIADAPTSRRDLLQTVQNCELVLQQVFKAASQCPQGSTWADTIPPKPLHAILERLRCLFDRIKDKLRPRKGFGKALRILKWPFDEKELGKILGMIEAEKANLDVVVSITSQSLLVGLKNDMKTVLDGLGSIQINQLTQALPASDSQHTQGKKRRVPSTESRKPSKRPKRPNAKMGKITICQTGTGFTMEAESMHEITFPLMSLMPNLSKILTHLADGGEMNLTRSDVSWVKDQFDALLKSAHLASAELVEEVETPGPGRQCQARDEAEDDDHTTSKRLKKYDSCTPGTSPASKRNSCRLQTPTGNLQVHTELRRNTDLTVVFSFTPDVHIPKEYRIGFTTTLRQFLDSQRIERSLTTFRVVEWEGSAFKAVEYGDIDSLRMLFSKRTAFPTDRLLEDGNTLIGHACREGQLPVCEFLLNAVEGTDPCETDSEGMNSLRLLMQGFQDEELQVLQNTQETERHGIVSRLLERGCLEDESWPERQAEDGSLHLSGFLDQETYPADELAGMVSMFIRRGAGMEIRDVFGKTPLLDNLSIPGEVGFRVMQELLEAGADTTAVDDKGNSVFHLLLEASWNCTAYLADKLRLLVQDASQSDLTQTNDQGYTPSDFAMTQALWPIWCTAMMQKRPKLIPKNLMARDSFAKADYQERMNRPSNPKTPTRPNRPKSQRTTLNLDLGQSKEDRGGPATASVSVPNDKTTRHCPCRPVSAPFVRWDGQETIGEQLPGLPRCLDCGGYVLPAEMEWRKRAALAKLRRRPKNEPLYPYKLYSTERETKRTMGDKERH